HRGLQQMDLERGAADIRAAEVARPQAQIFGHRQHRHAMRAGGGEYAIDLAERDAGLAERRDRRLAEQFNRRAARRFAGSGGRHADDGRRAAQARAHQTCSARSKTSAGSPSMAAMRALSLAPIGAVSTPSMRDIMRGPSARSTRAML